MKQKMKNIVVFYIAMPLILGLIITYVSGYFLHPLNPNDWYIDGFPAGWKKVEATGIPPNPPIFTFFNPVGFVLDALFWCGVVSVIVVVIISLAHESRKFLGGEKK